MTVTTSPAAGGNSVDVGGNAAAPATPELVNLTVDGIPVSAPKGALVIRAAEQVGVQIPRFCDHPLLDPVGACRQCLVDISTPGPDGSMRAMPKPQASCTITISEGMEVRTQHTSPVADKAQQGVMELLLINHPLDCPVCDKGGECPLQNQALSNGRARSRFEDVKRTYPKPINISTEVLLDRERCVLCARCTRFSDQIAGDPFIALVERGALQQIGIYAQKPFESVFSGNTVQICPVGALTSAAYRFRARPFDLISTPSACEHCASGCAMRTDHRRGVVLRRQAANDPEVNEEWNCDKGRWAFSYATAMDRLTEPLVRSEDGSFRVASWPEALDIAARGLETARDRSGVGVLVGGRVSAEDAYAYSKFARVALQTNDIDFRARPLSAEEAGFLAGAVARTYLTVSYADLESASSVLLVGFEPEDESPIVFLRLRKAVRKNATRVLTVAPFVSRGSHKLGAALVKAAPGTETEVLQALAERAEDAVGEVADAVFAPGSVILVGERMATVPGALSAAADLARASGAKLGWIPRRAGDRGAVEVGALPNLLPGGRPVADPVARDEVADAWGLPVGVSVPASEGRDTDAMVAAARSGRLGALVVGGVDPDDLADPVAAREALSRAFVVSLEIRESVVTQHADVVLPVAAHQEKAGSFVDWEGRVRPFQAALASNYMSDHRVLDLLGNEMGEYLGVRTTSATQADIQALGPWTGERPAIPSVAGVLSARSASLPQPGPGQAVLATWSHILDGGRMQDGEPFLSGTAPRAVARLSPVTAERLGVSDGHQVSVSTARGSITLPAVVTDMVDHVVWLPTNTPPSTVRASLGVDAGAVVTVTPKELP